MLLIAVAVVVVLVVIAAAALLVPRLLGGDDGSVALEHAGRIPVTAEGPSSAPEEAWKKSLDCESGECNITADSENVYVAVPGDDGSVDVTAYAGGSGDSLWTESIEGLTFVYSIEAGLVGLTEDNVILLDPDTGQELWKVKGELTNFHGDDLIVRRADGESVTSQLVDSGTGEERWKTDGQLYSCGSALAASDEDRVSLRDEASGEEQWNHKIDSGFADGEVWCSDDVVAFPAGDGEIGVVATSDGSERGAIEVDFDNRRETFVHDEVVYIVDNNDLIAYSTGGDSPEKAWSADWTGELDDAFYVDAGILLIDTEETAEIFAFDDGTSQAKASLSAYNDYYPTTSRLLAFDDNKVAAFGPDELDERWKIDVKDVQDVAIGGGRLFTISPDEVTAYS